MAFILGNPWAARENKRFLERDLNRSFALQDSGSREGRRARELTAVLKDTAYIVDFHQTSRPSERPFFIFPYNERSYRFAREIGPRHTIVTHWGKPFSAEGMCSDEFVNSQGGTGISLESAIGFDPYQIAVGVEASLWAIKAVGEARSGGEAFSRRRLDAAPQLYTWADIVAWPADGLVDLDEGWSNFKDVGAGQRLGAVGGKPLNARVSGKILFPKYLTREQQQELLSRPTELCRIMRPISEAELPA